jgi:hypothetical protein
MTAEMQDILIGRVLREKKEAEIHLALVQTQVKRAIGVLAAIASVGSIHPEHIWFTGVSTNTNYEHPHGEAFRVEDVDGRTIARLTSELRDAKDRVKELREEAERLDF